MVNHLSEGDLQTLLELKFSQGGKLLLDFLQERVKGARELLENHVDPQDIGNVGVLVGKIRAYRALEEFLMGEYAEPEAKNAK